MRGTMHCIAIILVIYFHLISGKSISESCKHENDILVICRCAGNEEFTLPTDFNYENLTILMISSCISVNLHFYSLPNANSIRDITIQNISGTLSFDPMLISRKIGGFEIKNVGKIPILSHDTFTSVTSIDLFKIENTRIINFDEQFTSIKIQQLILRNVTIDQMIGINFSGKASSLKIIDTRIHNISGNLNFAQFERIELANSTFEFHKPSEMSIQGSRAVIYNCTFYNVSVNVVTKRKIFMKNNCAGGKSSLRLASEEIESLDNRFPTEITYTEGGTSGIPYRANNNTVCIAGNCKCPKSFDRNSQDNFHVNVNLGIVLMMVNFYFV